MSRTIRDLVIILWVVPMMLQAEPLYAGRTSGQQLKNSSGSQLELPETLTKEELEYLGSHTHRRHGPGAPRYSYKRPARNRVRSGPPTKLMDQAWTLMLYKQGIITRDVAARVLTALDKSATGGMWSKPEVLTSLLEGDEDSASVPQLGRTLQEPMARMQLRDKQLDVIDATHDFLEVLLDAIERHSETIMPGMSHMAHAQPTTYGAYLLSVYDGVYRGLEHLDLAYKHTNENSGGCGATSGSGWPVDRYLLTELLGFDKLVEPTYDGEAGQDYAMNTLFALSNIMITLSRTAMDHSIWGMDGYHTHVVSSPHLRPSSMMPQKAHSGVAYENIRISANNVVTGMMNGVLGLKGEPHEDVMPSYLACKSANSASRAVETTMGTFGDIIKTMNVDKAKLLQLTRDGWGCTPDLVVKLVRDKGYGGRRAHRICAVMVRIAREHRGLKPYELTGAMLDEAARVAKEKEPGLSTEEIREIMDPVKFIERHNNTGDPNPRETLRIAKIRRKQLAESRRRQTEHCRRVEEAYKKLEAEIAAILGTK